MPRGACETRGENFHESKIIFDSRCDKRFLRRRILRRGLHNDDRDERRVLADWRELHGRLLSVNDGDRRIDYDGAHRPAADKVDKY